MIFFTESPLETEQIGKRLAKALKERVGKPVFIAMRGEMGVGKTAFVRGFASFFGIDGVKSPTYTMVNEYRGDATIYHFDMYRIESEDDLFSIGFTDFINEGAFSIAEWSENVTDLLPKDRITVTISRTPKNENERRIEIEGYEDSCI